MTYETEIKEFSETFNNILAAIVPTQPPEELSDMYLWLKECILYNVPHGKRTRGLAVAETYSLIVEQQGKTPSYTDMELARVLGWTVEFLQAAFLVTDDMMDQSSKRRGKPCWYKLVCSNIVCLHKNKLLS